MKEYYSAARLVAARLGPPLQANPTMLHCRIRFQDRLGEQCVGSVIKGPFTKGPVTKCPLDKRASDKMPPCDQMPLVTKRPLVTKCPLTQK